MNHEELSKRMGEYNPKQSHHSRMTKMGIILAKDRKATVQRELDERIASKSKSSALHAKMGKKETPKQHLKRKGGAKMFEHGDDWHN